MLRDIFDFDTLYNRRLPGDIKYQIDKEHKDVIPLWIADMDFKSPDAVLIFQPVYYPFSKIIKGNGRRLVVSELRYSEKKYQIRYDNFEEKIVRENVKMIIFCSPHNPVSRVWTKLLCRKN